MADHNHVWSAAVEAIPVPPSETQPAERVIPKMMKYQACRICGLQKPSQSTVAKKAKPKKTPAKKK